MSERDQYDPSGFFALRTPLLPFSVLARWGDGVRAPAVLHAGIPIDGVLSEDRARLLESLRALLVDPVLREALFVASPTLDTAIDAWLSNADDPRADGAPDVIVRYLARMAARSTPFGLFSGCSVGTIDSRTRLAIDHRRASRRHTRLDVHYLSALCDALATDPELRMRLRFRPSTGLNETPQHLRYAEAHDDSRIRARKYTLVSIERTSHLDAAIARAQNGATCAQIAETIVAHAPGVERGKADAFVQSLIDSQLLVSDVAPVVTGPEPIDDLIELLRAHDSPTAEILASTDRCIRALDVDGIGQPAARYRRIADSLHVLPAKPDLARLFQVDLHKPSRGSTLGTRVVRELARTAQHVAALTPKMSSEALQRFRDAFQSRYEGRTVPLLEALDEETGLGFASDLAGSSEPSPLLEGLRVPAETNAARVPFGDRERHLLRRVNDVARRGALEWALTEADVKQLSPREPARLPDAFAVMATLVASSSDAVDSGDFRFVLHGVSGPSGANLLGRFCHGDPELRAYVARHMRAEEALRPDAIFAELVHLPEGRLGNILCRPVLRAYEIVYLGRSGAEHERQILASDLLVSVEAKRIVLRSKRLGRTIIPRLTSAHNYGSAVLGVYRFLAALGMEDGSSCGWSWGVLEELPFLPRVVLGKAVLSLARWLVPSSTLASADKMSSADRYRRVQELRSEHRWPRWIAVADGDNVLPLDLENILHVDALSNFAKQRPMLVLQEVYPGEDGLLAEGPEGRYVHELVVPYVRRHGQTVRAGSDERPASPTRTSICRRFPPGSEWLYVKLYTGTAAADAVLTNIIAPLVRESRLAGAADRWFFLRYGDPDWHVRVRLHGDPARLVTEVLPRLHTLAAPWLTDGRIWKMQLDTYEREVERYGGDGGIQACERIFEADSDAAIGIVERLEPGEGHDARWRLALRGIHALLLDLGLDLAAGAKLMREMREAYAREHQADGALEADIGARFRAERASLELLLASRVGGNHPLEPGFALLEARSAALAPIVHELRDRERSGRLNQPLASIAVSLVHMHVNRVLRAEQRTHELVLCDFLARLYEAELARSRGAASDRRKHTATFTR